MIRLSMLVLGLVLSMPSAPVRACSPIRMRWCQEHRPDIVFVAQVLSVDLSNNTAIALVTAPHPDLPAPSEAIVGTQLELQAVHAAAGRRLLLAGTYRYGELTIYPAFQTQITDEDTVQLFYGRVVLSLAEAGVLITGSMRDCYAAFNARIPSGCEEGGCGVSARGESSGLGPALLALLLLAWARSRWCGTKGPLGARDTRSVGGTAWSPCGTPVAQSDAREANPLDKCWHGVCSSRAHIRRI